MDAIKKKMRFVFTCIEINLILWLMAAGIINNNKVSLDYKEYFFWICFIFAALIQHWAYYNLYKATKDVK